MHGDCVREGVIRSTCQVGEGLVGWNVGRRLKSLISIWYKCGVVGDTVRGQLAVAVSR